MSKANHERGPLRPADLARLQYVFDEISRRREIHPDSEEARELALTLLALHAAGLTDETVLLAAVGFRSPATKSA